MYSTVYVISHCCTHVHVNTFQNERISASLCMYIIILDTSVSLCGLYACMAGV